MRISACLLALLLSLCVSTLAHAAIKVPPILGSHMVLQRDVPVAIWGTAAPDEDVTVKFQAQEKKTKADAQGHWSLKLDPLSVGEPATMTISGTNTITLEDVLVGEVWVGSGQSNMGTSVRGYLKGDPVLAALAAETYPQVRLAAANGGWASAGPHNIPGYSALLFTFAVRLNQELHIPVGVVLGAVGGTPSGRWLSPEMFNSDKACQDEVAKAKAAFDEIKWAANDEKSQAEFKTDHAAWETKVAELKAKAQGQTTQPTLPREPSSPRHELKPGEVQGGKFGDLYQAHIKPAVPFTIRGVLWDQGEANTQVGSVDQYTLMGALIAGWRKEWGQGEFPFIYVQKPSGGGCAFDPKDPVTSQASPFGALPPKPVAEGAMGREAYLRMMHYPNAAMVTVSDLGSGTHPINKSGYGTRAARVALGMVYAKPVEYYGPVFDAMKIEGAQVHITFTHTGKGLIFKGGEKLQGFAIAGADKVFHWADATIDEKTGTIAVSSSNVPNPVAVRYAWSTVTPWANLFNKDGLPAVSFRTDTW